MDTNTATSTATSTQTKTNSFIDMHSHILPDIDDGSKNVAMSIEMLAEGVKQGIEIFTATPHCLLHREGSLDKFILSRSDSYAALINGLPEELEQVKIQLGAEIYLDHDVTKHDGIERLCIGDTNCVLVEFSTIKEDLRYAEWIYSLNRKGMRVIIAHVERYPFWKKLMDDCYGLDVTYQINAESFLSFGKRLHIGQIFKQIHRYIVSTDMHNTTSRPCNLLKAYNKAQSRYPEQVDDFFYNNAKRLLNKQVTAK